MTCDAILNSILNSVEDCNASQDANEKRRVYETHCINMVVRVWEKCLELLKENGFDTTDGQNLE